MPEITFPELRAMIEQIYTKTEPHRAACEARVVARMPLRKRREYIDDVERMRGPAAAEALREHLRQMWTRELKR